jgi:hypothetical protein
MQGRTCLSNIGRVNVHAVCCLPAVPHEAVHCDQSLLCFCLTIPVLQLYTCSPVTVKVLVESWALNLAQSTPAMHRRANESHTVNNYISGAREWARKSLKITHSCPGGVGGTGGAGSTQGQGGGGGTGEGPALNYAFDTVESLTMNNLYVERAPCILSDMCTENL